MRTLLRLSALTLSMLTASAFAAVPPTPCTGLIGCNGAGAVDGSNVIVDNLSQAASLLIMVAAALSVLFIVYAGFRMVIAIGDDSQIGEQKNAIIYVMIGLLFVILSQLIVSFVGTQNYGQVGDPKDFFLNFTSYGVSILLTLFNAAMVVAVIIGGGYMVHAQGKSDQFTKGKTIIQWSIGGAIFANLANALVQALARLFNVA
jgi:hypothetical protein